VTEYDDDDVEYNFYFFGNSHWRYTARLYLTSILQSIICFKTFRRGTFLSWAALQIEDLNLMGSVRWSGAMCHVMKERSLATVSSLSGIHLTSGGCNSKFKFLECLQV
jgi:hypothetical protein